SCSTGAAAAACWPSIPSRGTAFSCPASLTLRNQWRRGAAHSAGVRHEIVRFADVAETIRWTMGRDLATRLSCFAAAALLAACNGKISGGAGASPGGPPATGTGAAGMGAPPNGAAGAGGGAGLGAAGTGGNVDLAADLAGTMPSSVVRMLSQRELGNALEALVGFRPQALAQLPADKHDLTYDRVVEAQTVSSLHEDAFDAIADEGADKLLANDLAGVVPSCKPAAALGTDGAALGTARRPCVAAVVDALGPRAFRHAAVDPDQRAALLALYDQAASYRDGARLVLHGILRSPSFLYLVESGT